MIMQTGEQGQMNEIHQKGFLGEVILCILAILIL